MSIVKVDAAACTGDGLCVADCPAKILELTGDPPVPRLLADLDGVEELCIRCGHCVAICPAGAFEHEASPRDQSPAIDPALALGPEQVEQQLRSRRSIRCFRPEAVERRQLERAIELARYAPSGHNLQGVQWLVITDAAEVQQIAATVADWMRVVIREAPEMAAFLHLERVVEAWERGEDRICRGAPHLIVTHGPKGDRLTATACTLALSYLELAAPPLELGTCWAGYVNAAATSFPPLQQQLALPEGHLAMGSMMVGRPKYRYRRLPRREPPHITWR